MDNNKSIIVHDMVQGKGNNDIKQHKAYTKNKPFKYAFGRKYCIYINGDNNVPK